MAGWLVASYRVRQKRPWVQRLLKQKPVRLSRAQLESLAIVAYRQPITRPEIDDIRGVDSGGSLRTLLDRGLIRILGKKRTRATAFYGTTKEFLGVLQPQGRRIRRRCVSGYDLTESRDKVRAAGLTRRRRWGTAAGRPGLRCRRWRAGRRAPTSSSRRQRHRASGSDARWGIDPGCGSARPVELIDQQLADDAENLAKIDEMIRAVNTVSALDPALLAIRRQRPWSQRQAKVVLKPKPPQVAAEPDDASAR